MNWPFKHQHLSLPGILSLPTKMVRPTVGIRYHCTKLQSLHLEYPTVSDEQKQQMEKQKILLDETK